MVLLSGMVEDWREGDEDTKPTSREVAANLGTAEVGSRPCLGFPAFVAELC